MSKLGIINREKNIKQGAPLAFFLFFALSFNTIVLAQAPINFTYKTFGLEKEEDNVIQNAAHLDDFFESLYQLKIRNDRKINIVHIGDSHIQADYLTSVVRRNFQLQFGNAGRGLIVPARVAGTNEPANFKTSSSVTWSAKRCIYPDQPLPIGIGGITINTTLPNAKLNVLVNDLWIDYAFNTVTLFFQKDLSSFQFSVKDTARHELALIGSAQDPFANYSRVTWPQSINALTLETIQNSPEQKQATIFGLSLENGNSGVLYHAIGVNGAKVAHYNKAFYFAKQTVALTPDVFFISLGTNESLDYPYLDPNFLNHIDKLVNALRETNPLAKFVLITPPDSYRRKIKYNPGISKIREQILQYAVENGLAFWDMYKAIGGDHAADAWRKAGLLRPDGVHFTKDGYEYQGNLLFNALIKGYNQYVPNRPQ